MTRLSHVRRGKGGELGSAAKRRKGSKWEGRELLTRMLPLGHFQGKGRDMPSHRLYQVGTKQCWENQAL